MKEIKFFCDICDIEFPPKEYAFLTGQLIKIDKDFKQQVIPFEGHYCGKCTNLLLEEITKLKNAKDNNTTILDKQVKPRTANK